MSVQKALAGITLGTMESVVAQELTTKAIENFGISTATKAGYMKALGIFGILSAGLNELMQMALGTDIAFGFGGEYVGNFNGIDGYKEGYSFKQSIEAVKGMMGLDYQIDHNIVDRDGNKIGDGIEYSIDGSDVYGIGINSEWNYNVSFDDINYETFNGNGDYTAHNEDGDFVSSSFDGIDVTANEDGGYTVTDNNTGTTYTTDSNGNYSSSNDNTGIDGGGGYGNDTGAGLDGGNMGGDYGDDSDDDGTSDNGW
jgi:hypothetical protein